jgi:hypothetical protein
MSTFPASVLVKSQKKKFGPKFYTEAGQKYRITADVRHDDQCGNGHNTFSITGTIDRHERGIWRDDAGGCIHDEIAKHFSELAPFIKWHLTSTDGPMHYLENTIYQAGERDHWGLLKGEFRQHTSRGSLQANGVPGIPCWELELPERQARSVYAAEKPAPVVCEWKAYGTTGEGKARELDHARGSAVWPDATDAELCVPADELRAKLAARLPALMQEFKAAVESLGFVY